MYLVLITCTFRKILSMQKLPRRLDARDGPSIYQMSTATNSSRSSKDEGIHGVENLRYGRQDDWARCDDRPSRAFV